MSCREYKVDVCVQAPYEFVCKMKTPRFPVSIRRGSVVTRVYRLARADGRETFTAAWNVGGVRRTRQFARYAAAHAEATLKAEQLAAGKVNAAADLSGDDAASIVAARELCGDMPLISALREWRRARGLTSGNVIAAAEAWKARNVAKYARHKVSDIVDEYCRVMTKAGSTVPKGHASAFKFMKAEMGSEFIDSVGARRIETWLAKWKGASTRNTYRRRMSAVWRWAQKRGYLPRDTKTAVDQTERAREEAPEIGIINAETWARLLRLVHATAPDLIATAAIAGFCGLRRSELHAQEWEDINLAEKFLRVTKGKRGTPARRLVPLCDAAIEWLMFCPERKGVIGESLALDRLRKLAREAEPKIELPENAFRHSYISHRVAESGNVPQVALDSGNSVKMIDRHYRQLVTKPEGVAWFGVHPAVVGEAFTMDGKAVAHG